MQRPHSSERGRRRPRRRPGLQGLRLVALLRQFLVARSECEDCDDDGEEGAESGDDAGHDERRHGEALRRHRRRDGGGQRRRLRPEAEVNEEEVEPRDLGRVERRPLDILSCSSRINNNIVESGANMPQKILESFANSGVRAIFFLAVADKLKSGCAALFIPDELGSLLP